VTSWRCKLAGAIGEPFRVSRGVLMSSRLGASGARYNVVSAFALAAGGAG
jgi:2'-5' RNA ligase